MAACHRQRIRPAGSADVQRCVRKSQTRRNELYFDFGKGRRIMDDEKAGQNATDKKDDGAAAPLTDKIIDAVVDGAAALTKAAVKGAVKRVVRSGTKSKAGKTVAVAVKKAK